MRKELRPALTLLGLLTLLTGGVYPLLVTGVGRVVFPVQASGSLLRRDGVIVGSALIGQHFEGAAWFQSRPSATSAMAYDAAASSGSNFGPLNPALADSFRSRAAALRQANPGAPSLLPVDLLTSSGSGLDPHITRAGAELQVPRIARVRGLTEEAVRELVGRSTEGRQLGVLGEPRVNVLKLNLALDAQAKGAAQ
jgi:K+-transporting ATPase ATPase C chain